MVHIWHAATYKPTGVGKLGWALKTQQDERTSFKGGQNSDAVTGQK